MTEYEYVREKEPPVAFNLKLSRFRLKATKFLFKDPRMFVWAWIFYHILVIFLSWIFNVNVPANVWVPFSFADVEAMNSLMHSMISNDNMTSHISLAFILFLDFFLLWMIKSEVPKLKLSWFKILILEIFCFSIGIYSAFFRIGMLFFSINTLQITLAYKFGIKRFESKDEAHPFNPVKIFLLTGTYLIILRLFIWVGYGMIIGY